MLVHYNLWPASSGPKGPAPRNKRDLGFCWWTSRQGGKRHICRLQSLFGIFCPLHTGEGKRIQQSKLNFRVDNGKSTLSYGLYAESPINPTVDPFKCLVWCSADNTGVLHCIKLWPAA